MNIQGSANAEPFGGMRMLSESEMDAIANDVRTKPLSEVGRHVMPLLHHIVAMDDRECRRCRYWVPYNVVEASTGECLYHASEGARTKLDDLVSDGELIGDGGTGVSHLTPFDWSCRGWEERAPAGDDAQQSL